MLRSVIAVLLLVALTGCSSTGDFTNKSPEQIGAAIKEQDSNIQSTTVQKTENGAFVVTVVYLADPSPSPILSSTGDFAKIVKYIATSKGNSGVGYILIALNEPGVDKLGNKGQVHSVTLGWDMDMLRNANWNNLQDWQLINLARLVDIGPWGRKAVTKYCDEGASSYGDEFCRNAGHR